MAATLHLSSMSVPVSVVMPAYRLGPVIADNIRRVVEVLPDAEVTVVDDGSDDGTFEAAREAADTLPNVRVLRHEHNQGKGAALRTGALATTRPLVVFLDADLDLPPEQIPDLLSTMDEQHADVLVGAKRWGMRGGHYPFKRRVLSYLFTFVTRVLFRLPIDETQTGLKIMRREVVDDVFENLHVTRYASDLEILLRAHRAGYRLVEVPVALRVGASSQPLRFGTLWEMGRDTFRIFRWSLRR